MSETLNLMSPKFIGTHVALTDVITPNGQNIRHLGSVSRGGADPTVTMSGSHFMRQLKLVLLDRSHNTTQKDERLSCLMVCHFVMLLVTVISDLSFVQTA